MERDYGRSLAQKLQYMHILLSKDAKIYYLAETETYAQTLQQAVEMINREYNSPVCQTRVKNYLNYLFSTDFMNGGLEASELAPL